MNITAKSRYAVRALVELAQRAGDAPVPLGTIAEARGIPAQFLEQVFSRLRRAGIVRSHRGVKGGFSFSRPPEQISVLDVVEALDGPIEPAICTSATEACRRRAICSAAEVWADAKHAVEKTLSDVTVGELADRESKWDRVSNCYTWAESRRQET